MIILISYQSLSMNHYNCRQSVRLTDIEYLGFFFQRQHAQNFLRLKMPQLSAGGTEEARGGVTPLTTSGCATLVLAPSAGEQCCRRSLRRVMLRARVWAGEGWSCLQEGLVLALEP